MNRRSLFKSLTAAIVASAIELNFVVEAVVKAPHLFRLTIEEVLNREAVRLTEFWSEELLKKDTSLNPFQITDATR